MLDYDNQLAFENGFELSSVKGEKCYEYEETNTNPPRQATTHSIIWQFSMTNGVVLPTHNHSLQFFGGMPT